MVLQELEKRLAAEFAYKNQLQKQGIERKRRLDLVMDKLTILRTEMEAVVSRHQIVLDTPIAQKASRLLRAKEEEEELRRIAENGGEQDAGFGDGGSDVDGEDGVRGGASANVDEENNRNRGEGVASPVPTGGGKGGRGVRGVKRGGRGGSGRGAAAKRRRK